MLTETELVAILLDTLDHRERSSGVAYLTASAIPAGTRLPIPRADVSAPWDAALAFIDREPMANWAHSCRYVLIGRETGEVRSIDARLPPFTSDNRLGWRVVHKAGCVPDAVLALPR